MGLNHIPIYEGDEDPKIHWFICEKFWDAKNITDEDKQMAQFGATLQHCALTWFMNYTENQNRSKSDIKNNFLSFFKVQDVANMKKYLKTFIVIVTDWLIPSHYVLLI